MTQKHDLIHELPEFREQIHQLKLSDRHFGRLFDEYHDLDHAVHRIETGAQLATDEQLEDLKKQRLHLKDNLYAMLKSAQAPKTCCGSCGG